MQLGAEPCAHIICVCGAQACAGALRFLGRAARDGDLREGCGVGWWQQFIYSLIHKLILQAHPFMKLTAVVDSSSPSKRSSAGRTNLLPKSAQTGFYLQSDSTLRRFTCYAT